MQKVLAVADQFFTDVYVEVTGEDDALGVGDEGGDQVTELGQAGAREREGGRGQGA